METWSERVEIPTATGGVMGGYVARPAGSDARPAVLVYMEIFGVNAHIREVTERVAREGYVALAPDFFHRTMPGAELAYDDAGFQQGLKAMQALDADEMIQDARDAILFLRGRGDVRSARIGAIGFCIGGHMAYLTACETDVAATAAFYGGGIPADRGPGGRASTLSRTPKIAGKILCLFGAEDAMIPAEQVEAVRNALREADVRHEVRVYAGAGHGFFCDARDAYHPEAAADAWERVKHLFAEELGR